MITVLDKRIKVVEGDPPAYISEVKINDSDNIYYINIATRLRTEYMVSNTSMIAYFNKEINISLNEIEFYEMYGTYEDTQKKSRYAGLFKYAYTAILYFSKQNKLIEK